MSTLTYLQGLHLKSNRLFICNNIQHTTNALCLYILLNFCTPESKTMPHAKEDVIILYGVLYVYRYTYIIYRLQVPIYVYIQELIILIFTVLAMKKYKIILIVIALSSVADINCKNYII